MKRFNVRVYGILIHNEHIILNEELIFGQKIVKFPGGGLDWGEGTIDCVKREWREELGLDITVLEHFYTTDFFQHSAFDDSQVISIYYRVQAAQLPTGFTNFVANERTFWKPLCELGPDDFQLPIDKKVGALLQDCYANGTL